MSDEKNEYEIKLGVGPWPELFSVMWNGEWTCYFRTEEEAQDDIDRLRQKDKQEKSNK